jgi:hypothetical protein
MSAISAAPVAIVLASSAMATLPPSQPLAHNARADHRRQEQQRADETQQPSDAKRLGFMTRPIASSSFGAGPAPLAEPAAGPETGRSPVEHRKGVAEGACDLLRRSLTAAGSGMPQCAVTGCPGQNGQTSPAALSHTVKMKFILGASGAANSSQDLLRSPPSQSPSRQLRQRLGTEPCPKDGCPR